MKIVEQSVELLKHDIDPYKFIEKCARTCYKSEDKITDESAVKMVAALATNKHYAMFEHEYVYFRLSTDAMDIFLTEIDPPLLKYINIGYDGYISGSLRSFIELIENYKHPAVQWIAKLLNEKYPEIINDDMAPFYAREDDWKNVICLVSRQDMIDNSSAYSLKISLPHTLRFITNRGVANELVRHRPASFAQESTRYVDYGNDKNSNQISVIKPHIGSTDILNYENWHYAMLMAETQYMNLRKGGIPAEIARGVLPMDLKTEIVITATEEEWQHIVDLRYHGTTGRPHPQIKELIGMAYPILQEESNGRIK